MAFPWANTFILLLVLAELVTGFFGLVSGSETEAVFILVHRAGGWGIVVLLAWKGRNVVWSLRRPKRGAPRMASIVLFGMLTVTLTLGIAWASAGPFYFSPFSGVSWHIYAGAALAPVMLWHAAYQSSGWTRRLTRTVRNLIRVPSGVGAPGDGNGVWPERRSFLRVAGVAVLSVAVWQSVEAVYALANLAGARRRFTGSYERGSYAGNGFPLTSWLNDNPAPVDLDSWRLEVGGAVGQGLELAYADLPADSEITATLDCTGGWFSTQVWRGMSVARLLELAEVGPEASSVTFTSVTGYYRRFSIDEAKGYILATRVGDEVLAHGHGYPLRLVAPGKRGFEWIKWVRSVEVNTTPKWLQPPLPVQ